MITEPPPSRQTYITTFDTVRAIAVLAVFISHSGLAKLIPSPKITRGIEVLSPGHFGVILFFVLSGFLITRILIKSRGRQNAYKNFLVRRSLRIFPIYYLTILVLLFITPGGYLGECAAYISNYTFAFDNSPNPMRHSWSLCVEEHFYLVWPPIVLFLSMRLSRACAFALFPLVSVIGAVLVYTLWPEHANGLFYRGTNFQVFALSLGAAMAFGEDWLRLNPRRTFTVGAVFLVLGTAAGGAMIALRAPNYVTKFYTFSLLSVGVTSLFLGFNDRGGGVCRLLSNPVTSYIGRISYGLYLYHFPVYFYFGTLTDESPSPGTILLATALTFAIAITSFHVLEQPLLKLKKHFT